MGACLPKSNRGGTDLVSVEGVGSAESNNPRREDGPGDDGKEIKLSHGAEQALRSAHASSSFLVRPVAEQEFPLAEASSLEWLNVAMEVLWPYADKAMQDKVQREIEPALKEAMPGPLKGIHFSEFNLGGSPPVLGPLELYKKEKQRHMGIELDIGVNWTCDASIKIEAPPLLTLGIKKIRLEGEISIVLRPLMDSLPIVGGIQLFMISPPKIDWEFHTEGVASLVELPMVTSKLREVVHNALSSSLVLPNRCFIHWIWGREHEVDITAMHFPVPEAVIRLGVVEARGLDGHDWNLFGKATSDPYAEIKVGARSHTTPTIEKTLDPKWGEDGFADFFCFNQKQFVSVEVWDADVTGRDLIGRLGGTTHEGGFKRLRIWELLKEPDCWWPVLVEGKDGLLQKAGEIKLMARPYDLTSHADKVAVKVPSEGPKASHTALIALQLRALRGLPRERATGARLSITCEDQVLETHASEFTEPYQDETYDADYVPIDPAFQRTLEHMATKTTPPMSTKDIAAISGLPVSQIERVLKMRPSFTARWMQGFNILIRDIDTAILDIKLLIPGKDLEHVSEEVKIMEPILIRSLLEAPHMRRDDLLELIWRSRRVDTGHLESKGSMRDMLEGATGISLASPSMHSARQKSVPAELSGPFDLDAQVQLFGLAEALPDLGMSRVQSKAKSSPRQAGRQSAF